MTKTSSAALAAHITPTFILVSNTRSEAEKRLGSISRGEPMVQVYKDETRSWWDLVDDNDVYEAISNDEFQAFVRLVSATA